MLQNCDGRRAKPVPIKRQPLGGQSERCPPAGRAIAAITSDGNTVRKHREETALATLSPVGSEPYYPQLTQSRHFARSDL